MATETISITVPRPTARQFRSTVGRGQVSSVVAKIMKEYIQKNAWKNIHEHAQKRVKKYGKNISTDSLISSYKDDRK